MRSYSQYCALAKALDVVGNRWTLLIVRELLVRGACRYTDLQHGLPGIATNLLADRLRELEDAGLVLREAAAAPVATDLFRLTARGLELEPMLEQLAHWGAPLLAKAPKTDAFRSYWLALPARLHLVDRRRHEKPISIEIRAGGTPLTIEAVDGEIRTRAGAAVAPDLVLTGTGAVVTGLLMGRLDLAAATAAGLKQQGDASVLRRLQPRSAS